jgi:hypothetical protein
MAAHASELVVSVDKPGNYHVDAPRPFYPKKPASAYFGGVRVGKSYVSYHLMPVYTDAALLASISPQLKKRMQGKSCFNFTKLDEAEKVELGELTRRSVEVYRVMGML